MYGLFLTWIPRYFKFLFQLLHIDLQLLQGEHLSEIKGIAEDLEIDYIDAVLINYIYEFEAFCTSIIVKNSNGTIIHGRNLDFGFSEALRNTTYIANFYKNDEHIFDAVMFAGYIGIMTAEKAGAYSLSINLRQPIKSK